MKSVSSLISGVAIFCMGTGLSFYHGIFGLIYPQPVDNYFWGFVILAASLLSESITLFIAINSIRRGARAMNMAFLEYGKTYFYIL
jgi:solute carrier family 30 (zinc transporter), member 9